ncbi:MAG: 50S ribosomal protein L23 [Cyanobacteria bacterium QS_8_64_29]|nr:MAG: 50S ribosomal protein L23 [Cyanobacteria bacterium QS_8_64_29]
MTESDARNLIDLVRQPIVTEKAMLQLEDNKYVFDVARSATKPQIRAAIERLFAVSVIKVNTQRPPRKKRRVGRYAGYKPQYKRAIVTLAAGDAIQLFPEV